MDYEKKYKNALEWARQVMTGETGFIQKEVEEVFPELKKSGDEIRKEIISALKNANYKGVYDKHLTWLEKQGEKATDEMIETFRTEYEKGRADAIAEMQGKHKPAWSKEDEKIYQSIMDDTVLENQLNDKQTNWLRDIKYRYFPQPQNRWKPSEEQLNNILDVLSFDNCTPKRRELLKSLYDDLNKL